MRMRPTCNRDADSDVSARPLWPTEIKLLSNYEPGRTIPEPLNNRLLDEPLVVVEIAEHSRWREGDEARLTLADRERPSGAPARVTRIGAGLRGTAVHGTGGRQLGPASDARLAGLDRGGGVGDPRIAGQTSPARGFARAKYGYPWDIRT
jgi:hypothetical protein